MDQKAIFLTILGMALVTYIPRLLPTWLLASRQLPNIIVTWLRYVPASVLSAMLIPMLLVREGELFLSVNNVYLLAGLPTLIVALKTRSLFGSVITGMIVVAVARLLGM